MIQKTIILVYILLTIIIGVWTKKKTKDSKAFDGANLGLLLCVCAGAGEWLGGTATTGISEYGYLYGISGAWYTIANGIGVCVLAIFFAKMFRSLETPTVSGILGKFIGEKAGSVSGILLIFIMLTLGTSPMMAVGTLGEAMFGIDSAWAIVIMGIGIIIYTIFGGMMAVSYTNVMHCIVLFGGMLAAVVVCLGELNGLSGLKAALPQSYFLPRSIGTPKVVSWIIASVLGACTAQAGLQPVLGAKDENTAVRSSFGIAVLIAPFGLLTALLGMIARVRFPELSNAKMALPTLLMEMSPLLGGIVMASILAAVLSTASPIFLACGTLFTRDIYTKVVRNKNDAEILKVSRMATILAGVICILSSIILSKVSTVLDLVYFAYSLRGSLFVILLLGIYWKKTSQTGAILAMVLTGIAGSVWVIYKGLCGVYPIHPLFTETYVSVVVALVTTIVGSLVFKRK